jgi:hypothetical protein
MCVRATRYARRAAPAGGHRFVHVATDVEVMDKTFRAVLQKSPSKGGWTYVVMDRSAGSFGTKGLVKVEGTLDGQPFKVPSWRSVDGTHKLPIKAELREKIGKGQGDTATVRLPGRLPK